MQPRFLVGFSASLILAGCQTSDSRPIVVDQVQPVEQVSGTTARLQAIGVVDSSVVWVSGTRGTYARTLDGGNRWTVGQVPEADSLEFRDLHAVSDQVAYLLSAGSGDRSRIYKTTDGGTTWKLQFRNTEPKAFFDCLAFWDAEHVMVMSDAVDGVFPVLTTEDGGATWNPIPATRLPPALPGEGAFAASGTCVVTVGHQTALIATGASGLSARVLRTEDRGATWSVAETPVVHDTTLAGLTSVAMLDRLQGVAVGGNLAKPDAPLDAVAFTEDGGLTWELGGRVPFPGTIFAAIPVPDSRGLIVAVGPKGSAYTQDLGRTWVAIDTLNYWSAGFAGLSAGWAVGPGGRITKLGFTPANR